MSAHCKNHLLKAYIRDLNNSNNSLGTEIYHPGTIVIIIIITTGHAVCQQPAESVRQEGGNATEATASIIQVQCAKHAEGRADELNNLLQRFIKLHILEHACLKMQAKITGLVIISSFRHTSLRRRQPKLFFFFFLTCSHLSVNAMKCK